MKNLNAGEIGFANQSHRGANLVQAVVQLFLVMREPVSVVLVVFISIVSEGC